MVHIVFKGLIKNNIWKILCSLLKFDLWHDGWRWMEELQLALIKNFVFHPFKSHKQTELMIIMVHTWSVSFAILFMNETEQKVILCS
jgi:hypothetical protein